LKGKRGASGMPLGKKRLDRRVGIREKDTICAPSSDRGKVFLPKQRAMGGVVAERPPKLRKEVEDRSLGRKRLETMMVVQ